MKKPKETKAEKIRNDQIRAMAKDQFEEEGDLELDEGAVVSEGDDNGAYVQMWKWVDFSGTVLCKDKECSDLTCPAHEDDGIA